MFIFYKLFFVTTNFNNKNNLFFLLTNRFFCDITFGIKIVARSSSIVPLF